MMSMPRAGLSFCEAGRIMNGKIGDFRTSSSTTFGVLSCMMKV